MGSNYGTKLQGLLKIWSGWSNAGYCDHLHVVVRACVRYRPVKALRVVVVGRRSGLVQLVVTEELFLMGSGLH